MDGSWATVVPAAAAASDALPRPTAAGSGGAWTRLTARGLAGRLFAALRQGVRRQTQVAAETLEADETCRTSATQMDLEADLQPQRESRQVKSGAKENEELELLLADIAAQTALLQQEMRQGGLRKCEAEVQISHTELQKQKIARQLLEEQLKTLECQLLDSTAEKEEIRSLLKDLAAQTSACAKAQEQVQKALQDMEELGAANGAVKVDEGMESTTQLQDMLVELQPSNDAVKALLKTSCDHLHRQRVEREILEAKLRSMECQLSDATKQDELKTLLRNFALYTAVNLKAEAAIQAVLNDLEALKASKDLEVAIASFMGDAKAAAKAEEAPKGATADATNSGLAPNSAGDSAAAAPVEVPRPVAAAHRYDLKEPRAFAQFLQDADIRLIRAKYLHDLAQSKRPLPRRQEAELCKFEFDGKAESALVSHAEVQNWAAGARTATICSVSHAWETREHPDPCRYQLQLIADRAAWYEAAFETDVWIFYDFTSLFQYERLFSEEERSFRAAMANMHIMYAHECTMTFIIEHLTPTDVWESTMKNDQELIPVWDDKLQSIKSKPLNCLIENRTEYLERGWCIGEISWSSLRTHNSQSQRIDWLGSDQVEPGQGQGLTGKVPLTPDKFKERMKRAKFTHRDKDLPIVVELQEKIFDEKVAVCEHLVLKGLPEQEIVALAEALPLYRSLKTLKLDIFECSEEAAEAFGKALATSQIVSLDLRNPRPGSGALMGKAVVDALTTNQSLTSIGAEDASIFNLAAKKALEKALRRNRSIKDRLPLDAPVRLKVVADALERNSLGTSVTVDPAEDQIDDQKAKAVAQLLKSGSPVKSVKSIDLGNTCISDDGAQALAEALRCNRTLEVLCLQEDQITDVGAKALAEALAVNKTLRSLTMGFYEALRTVEEMKRGRGDDFRFISREEDKKEAEGCRGDILEAAGNGKVGAVRHLLRTEPGSVRRTGFFGDTPLHLAAEKGKAEVVELLLAANAPVDVQNNGGWTPLHKAALNGHAEVVQLLLKAKAQVDVQKNDGRTPLHMAAAGGHVEVVNLLVEVASLGVQDKDGNTPLHRAAENGSAEVVELLLAANAPVDVQNNGGETPLHTAARDGHAEVVQLLLTAKAQVDVQEIRGRTPLHVAAAEGHVEVVNLLVEVASLGVQDKDGWTPLHYAARNGHAEVVQRLVKAKAQVDVQDNDGQIPLHVAAWNGHVEVVKLLVEVASLGVQDKDGDTPLHDAAYRGKTEVVELLLAANAPVDVQNKKGQTPLDLAREEGKAEVEQLLEAAQAVAPRAE